MVYGLENQDVRPLVIDPVFNARRAVPGIPAHHRSDCEIRSLGGDQPLKAVGQ
ncbi:hypothetical protein [Mycobacterium xenopi]|uniref:Uncharacterized protein n=2 Tax=Mycobacterium xenopi TaxID=1789 RepID=A0AAD1H0G1_MYCXE|nr:hypothetical protein [Mycobacterium xenopi]EUA42299.1 hypothetical protein I553_6159 [Mycobacterium xenopi 4042]EUA44533.1 hypothetical protein I552_4306 [Mycobacterium xenopi 3993]MDA3640300.1 hypothetical protein [Mycobacterium xenopi]MDA3658463.1 hypothetical protein [Mycobacterium xenopi]MDA3662588.1 hypothetical protein [Mycobacterium xenopi]